MSANQEPVLLSSDDNGVRTLTLFATADSTEAYAAFADKRESSFTGRWAVPRSE
jgi:hypothetical protein